jgi:hypothetical protein
LQASVEPSILSGGHLPYAMRAGEQGLTGLFVVGSNVVVHRLACLFCQFKPHRPPGLFLTNGRPIDGISIRSDVLDLQGDEIAASEFAVDCQIEYCQITRSLLDLELGPDSPDMLLP